MAVPHQLFRRVPDPPIHLTVLWSSPRYDGSREAERETEADGVRPPRHLVWRNDMQETRKDDAGNEERASN
jgi:hypothetical protein